MLHVADRVERDDLGGFTGRVVRLDPAALVRLRARGDRVTAWAVTPFDVLVTRAVRAGLTPPEVTVSGHELLAALAVTRDARVDPGRPADRGWRAELPDHDDWRAVEEVPVVELAALAERGIALAREHRAHLGGAGDSVTIPPTGLLDRTVLTATGDGMRVRVSLRCLFALSGMGFLGADTEQDRARVSANDSWMRLDVRYGAVVRRRRTMLPLLV